MKIIIDISEDKYEALKIGSKQRVGLGELEKAVLNGEIISKGHEIKYLRYSETLVQIPAHDITVTLPMKIEYDKDRDRWLIDVKESHRYIDAFLSEYVFFDPDLEPLKMAINPKGD